jgi:hypothetical protein
MNEWVVKRKQQVAAGGPQDESQLDGGQKRDDCDDDVAGV